jgi:hypothetical protein
VRVYQPPAVNTPLDDLLCSALLTGFGTAAATAHCNPGTLTGLSAIPGSFYTGAAGLAVEQQLAQKTPTTGVSTEEGSDLENMFHYYATLFFRATLESDTSASQLVAQNKYPDLLLGVFDNMVPAVARSPFNLQNRTIQYDISADGTYHVVTVTNRTDGNIANPAGNPGATLVSPLAAWSRSSVTPPAFPLAMGSFPLPSGGNALVNSTQFVWVSLAGSLSFTGGRSTIDYSYNTPRLDGWMAQNGIASFAVFCTQLANFGAVTAASPVNKVYVENTAGFFRVTYYQVSIANSYYPGFFNVRATLYPNGTIVQEFDGTIPNNIFDLGAGVPSGVVGYSSGRLYIDPATGKYNAALHPKIRTFDDITTSGLGSTRSDAVFQVFTAKESEQWA